MATIETDIENYLAANGRSTTSEMAGTLGYDTRKIRKASKKMMSNGRINGDKPRRIPAYIINGEYVVLPDEKSALITVISKHGTLPSGANSMTVNQLRNYVVQHIADRVVGGPFIWEFW